MVTQKLTAIRRILGHSNFTLITVGQKGVSTFTYGKETLEDAVLIAISIKSTYDTLMQQIEQQAAEHGELRALEALRNATDTLGVGEGDGKTE
jgi:hypothetical protein